MRTSRSRWCLWAAAVACCVTTTASADTLGVSTPVGWSGYGSRMLRFPVSGAPVMVVDAPGSTEVDYSAGSPYPVEAWALTNPYVMRGAIAASGDPDTMRVGGFFRDELYVESADGNPVDVELVFHVTGTWEVLGTDPFGLLRALWMYPDGSISSFGALAWADAATIDGTSASTGTFDLDIVLSSTQYGHVVASGMYLPTSVTLYGDVRNVSLDWANTAVLTDVRLFQEGRRLEAGAFTIVSANGTAAFAGFEQRMPTQMPEPAALVLLGLAALAGATRLRH